MQEYAYIRVSTKDQNIDRQLEALKAFNLPVKNIFCDYQSGKDFQRPAYKKLMKRIRRGDLLIIKSIDRLGRNYNEILTQWQYITKEIGADIKVLDMNLLDTQTKNGNLTGVLIADLVLQIFAYVAQVEREMIHQRQAEGIAAAKAKGKHLGRPILEKPENYPDIYRKIRNRQMTLREAAVYLGVSKSTVQRWVAADITEADYSLN